MTFLYTIRHERNPAGEERYAVYEEVPQSVPPVLMRTFETREEAREYVNSLSWQAVDSATNERIYSQPL